MSKKQTGQRKSLLTGASVLAAAAAAFAAAPAMAQDNTNNANANSGDDEAIVVTGTRLVRQDFEAISPVTTVGAEQLELTATMTTDTLLNELPQIIPGNTRTSNNSGGEDFSTVDLRGLGPNRTLVLVNGERIPASATDGTVDINNIPASLISRIEVVTGGASAVYGSDAMAGVINFVLKDDYEGGELNMTYGSEMSTGNAAEFEANGLVGGNFANGRGNITAYASYYNRNKVLQSEYDFSRVSGAICYNSTHSNAYFICDSRADATGNLITLSGGSGTPPWGWITNNPANPFKNLSVLLPARFGAGNTDTNCDGVAGGAVNTGNLSFNNAGQLTPRYTAGFCAIPDRSIGSSRYSFAPDNYLIIPAERINLTTNGHYDISDDVRLSFTMNYTNSRQEVQLAPTPATGLTVSLTPAMQTLISTNHPDLWTALQSRTNPLAPFVEDRRTTEVGTRNSYNESNAFYFLASLEGSLGDNWDWNLTGSYGQILFAERAVNSVNRSALNQGLAGCQNPTTGAPLGNGALPGCVPIDIFGPGTLTPAMVSFIRVNTFQHVIIEENRMSGYVRGDLFSLPAGAVSSVFGFEYRDTYAEFTVDNEQRTGNIYGFNALQDQRGSVDVYELYTELAVPILSDVPGAHYLGLEAGYRRSNYSSVGDIDSYKIGGEWAPVSWLRFRAIYNEATRAPSVFELFQAGDQGFPAYTDPCTDGKGHNATCLAAPGTAAITPAAYPGFAANNSQVQAFAFGNPNLSPETAKTQTYGLVFQPDWFPLGDIRATIDYYDIEIDNVVAGLGAQFFINDCYINGNVAGGCARIVRDPTTGQITSVNTTISNQSVRETKGTDIQLEWSLPIGPGQFTINELYSILDSFQINGAEFAGTTSAAIGGALPDYKSVLSLTYTAGDWTLFTRWSYVPEITSASFGHTTAPAASYIDASVRWNLTDNFTLTGVINNVTDDQAPQTADGFFSQANTDPQVYRVLGRSFAVSARLRF